MIPADKYQLTCTLQKVTQKLRECARFGQKVCHLVKVIIGHSHVFGISGHIDNLRKNRCMFIICKEGYTHNKMGQLEVCSSVHLCFGVS